MVSPFKFQYITIAVALLQVYCATGQQNKSVPGNRVTICDYLGKIKAEPTWNIIDTVPLNFTTYHTQGITKAGKYYYLSAVKVNRPPEKYNTPINGYDRDNGEGTGYLFKFTEAGKLVDSICLGKDEIYHPGGIDFDGQYIWVPVCEYRPFGKSMIYRIDPENMRAVLITAIPDAIGAVAYNRDADELVGMNWGSRVFYRWKIDQPAKKVNAVLKEEKGQVNPHFYVDFQDCNYAGNGKMFCSGLRSYKNQKGEAVKLGGLELIDMKTYQAILQLPVTCYTVNNVILTNNPFYIDVVNNDLQYYFIPEDDKSVLYIYRLQ